VVDQSANFIGSIPEQYDRGMGPVMFVDFGADMANRVAAVRPNRLLEIASGTGIVTRMLRDSLPPESRITATDLNAPMLEVARKKFRVGEQIDFQPADATALPFSHAIFDAVVCQFGVMFFPDKERSYREVCRVLCAGGHYFFSVWDSHRHNPFARLAHEIIGSFFPSDPPKFYELPYGYHLIDPIKETLLDSGFTDIKADVLSQERIIPDVTSFARGMVYGNPVIEQIRARGGVDPDRIAEALANSFREQLGSDPCRTPMQVIMFEARCHRRDDRG
jgi:ubiquinone/menaquinone biosynthesis C-methylase UbiE